MRVHSLDTVERVTDFSSAADHTLTVRKWHEMSMPLSVPSERSELKINESAFDYTVDNTTAAAPTMDQIFHREQGTREKFLKKRAEDLGLATAETTLPESKTAEEALADNQIDVRDLARSGSRRRWKFDGPWLGSMSNTEFEVWLKKKALTRSEDLMRRLRQAERDWILSRRRLDALNDGTPLDQVSQKVDEVSIDRRIRRLRRDSANPDAELGRIVRQYLDLPGFTDAKSSSTRISQSELRKPPKTHPSAGLSYLRSSSYLENHPLLGPQAQHAPVSARLVQLKAFRHQPKLGVAGVVTNEENITSAQSSGSRGRARQAGGNGFAPLDRRYWAQPKEARIDPQGRVMLSVGNPNNHAISVREGNLGESTVPQQPRSRVQGFDSSLDAKSLA
jgi:hypothetical protein